MSRHRSPRGRRGNTTSVVDLRASLAEAESRAQQARASADASSSVGARSSASRAGVTVAEPAKGARPPAGDVETTRGQRTAAPLFEPEVAVPAPRSALLDSGPALFRPSALDLETTRIVEPFTLSTASEPDNEEPPPPPAGGTGRPEADEPPPRRRRARSTAKGRRPGGLVVGLVTAAVVALVVGGTTLVKAGKLGVLSPDSGASTPAVQAQPAQPPRPPLAAPPPPTPEQLAAQQQERAKQQAEAAKKKQQEAAASDPAQAVMSLANCTKRVSDGSSLNQAIASASPGQKICAIGNMASRLEITRSGTANAPITVIGNGSTVVKGITVKASNVVVGGFTAVGAQAPGIEMTGNNITMRNNKVGHTTGGDYDGMRFFGNNLKILDNTISDINPDGTGAHADCMQTFQSGTPSSKNVVISGNRCQNIANMCLMAEGPGDLGDGGEGEGESSNWLYANNYCDNRASQALMIEAVQNVTVRNNQIVGKVDKAFAFDVGSTGAKVLGNKIGPGIGYVVGMDDTSRKGYQGPAVGGGP